MEDLPKQIGDLPGIPIRSPQRWPRPTHFRMSQRIHHSGYQECNEEYANAFSSRVHYGKRRPRERSVH